jgi:hypothetical protein
MSEPPSTSRVARTGAAVTSDILFCANSIVNWIQFLPSLSQTACNAMEELSRTAQHGSQGVDVNSFASNKEDGTCGR